MSYVLPHYSRYKDTEKILWNNNSTFGVYAVPDRLKNLQPSDLISVKITPGLAGRPDLIANEHYNSPYYSWIITMYNSPLNPIGWPKNGDLILIPRPGIIHEIING